MLSASNASRLSIQRRLSPRLSNRAQVKAMGLFSGLFGGGTPKPGCELAPKEPPPGLKLATFAGGCFWGLELAYQRVPGVVSTSVGYIAGQDVSPTYEKVCSGRTGHTEAVQCAYNEKEVGYEELLDVFFNRVDPTTLNKQGNDSGTQYRSGIYWHDEAQKKAVLARVAEVNEKLAKGTYGSKFSKNTVVTELKAAGDYYVAEDYHQQYLSKGGRGGRPQSAEKGSKDTIRCYG